RPPFTWAARWRKSQPRKPRCGRATTQNGPSSSSASRANSTVPERPRASAPGGHTATCRRGARPTSPTESITRAKVSPLDSKIRILARLVLGILDLELYNPNYVGGAITGGASNFSQLFTRPVARLNPYTTPNPRIFLCSSSTPPGGGVHGMCGFYAARAAQRRL